MVGSTYPKKKKLGSNQSSKNFTSRILVLWQRDSAIAMKLTLDFHRKYNHQHNLLLIPNSRIGSKKHAYIFLSINLKHESKELNKNDEAQKMKTTQPNDIHTYIVFK